MPTSAVKPTEIVSSMEGHTSDVWTGTASDLRKSLIYSSPSTVLPPTAAALGTKLRASATPLREAGFLDITFDRSGTERTIRIVRLSRRSD